MAAHAHLGGAGAEGGGAGRERGALRRLADARRAERPGRVEAVVAGPERVVPDQVLVGGLVRRVAEDADLVVGLPRDLQRAQVVGGVHDPGAGGRGIRHDAHDEQRGGERERG